MGTFSILLYITWIFHPLSKLFGFYTNFHCETLTSHYVYGQPCDCGCLLSFYGLSFSNYCTPRTKIGPSYISFSFFLFFQNKHICISFCNKLKSTRINVLSMSWLNVSQYLLAFIYFPWLPPVTSLTASHKCVFHHHKPTRYLIAVNSIVLPECIKCQHLLSVNLSDSHVNKWLRTFLPNALLLVVTEP